MAVTDKTTLAERYVIRKKSDVLLFLVDRSKTQKFWWSYNPRYAFIFRDKQAAIDKAKSFRFGDFEVLSVQQMHDMRRREDDMHKASQRARGFDPDDYEHPFSSEALGQW